MSRSATRSIHWAWSLAGSCGLCWSFVGLLFALADPGAHFWAYVFGGWCAVLQAIFTSVAFAARFRRRGCKNELPRRA